MSMEIKYRGERGGGAFLTKALSMNHRDGKKELVLMRLGLMMNKQEQR